MLSLPRGTWSSPPLPSSTRPEEDHAAAEPPSGTRGHPWLLTSRVVPQPTSRCFSQYPSPSAVVTPQPDPSVSSPLATRLPRNPAGTTTASHAWPHVTETVAGRGEGGLNQLAEDPQVPRGASQASPQHRCPLEFPHFSISALGRTGKEAAPGSELLYRVTPGHRCGHDDPEGSP